MFGILDRYIFRHILITAAMTLLVIFSMVFLMLMLGEMRNIGEGDYHFMQALSYVSLRLPIEIYQFSPMILLMGTLLGMHLLSTHQEFIVMRASGYSMRRLLFTVLQSGIIIMAALMLIGEGIGPILSYKAEVHKENDKNAGQAVVTAAGVWLHLGNNFIHIRRVVDRRRLENVTRYEFDANHHLTAAYFAKVLQLTNDKIWEMQDVEKTIFTTAGTESSYVKNLNWDLKLNANLFTIGLVNPNEMSLKRLANFSNYLHKNGLQAAEYQFSFWQRIFQPFSALVMVFLALPFVISTHSHFSAGKRMLFGIFIGFAFFILNALLGQMSIVYQLPPFFSALFPILFFMMIGLYLFHRLARP